MQRRCSVHRRRKENDWKIRYFHYRNIGKEAKFAKCGAYVDVPEIGDSNLKALYDVYRKENGIISL